MKEKISIVIPVFNSSDSIEILYKKLKAELNKKFYDHEILLIDDNSIDNSFNKLIELNKKDKNVKIIKLNKNYGQQNALMCGFNYAEGDYIVTMDDDLQHNPKDIIKLYNEIKKGYDIVYGIPEVRQQLFYRRIGSYFTDKMFNILTKKNPKIKVSSFRILNRKLLKKVIMDNRSFVYLSAIILNITDNIGNISIEHNERFQGRSNYNFFKLLKLFLKLYIYYSDISFLKIFKTNNPQFRIKHIIGFNNQGEKKL